MNARAYLQRQSGFREHLGEGLDATVYWCRHGRTPRRSTPAALARSPVSAPALVACSVGLEPAQLRSVQFTAAIVRALLVVDELGEDPAVGADTDNARARRRACTFARTRGGA